MAMTAKQIRYFGTKAQKAALKRKRSGPKKSTSSARSRGARKAARTRAKLSYKVVRFVKRHPVATTALASTGTGAAIPAVRRAVLGAGRGLLSRLSR